MLSVEDGVEGRDHRHSRSQGIARGPDCRQGRPVVQWSELPEFLDRCHHIVIDERGGSETATPVHDAMPHRLGGPREPVLAEPSEHPFHCRAVVGDLGRPRRVDPSAVARSTVARRPIPSTEPQARRSSASGDATGVSESRNFSDDEPQLIASTLKGGPPAPERRRAVFLC